MSYTKPLSKNEKRFFFIGVPLLIVITLLAILFLVVRDNSDTAAPAGHVAGAPAVVAQTQDMNGSWESPADNGVKIVATIENTTIKISMKSADITMVYWTGTFPAKVTVGDTVASVKNDDEMQMTMDTVKTKNFIIGDNSLTFDMGMMNVTKTVHMSRV